MDASISKWIVKALLDARPDVATIDFALLNQVEEGHLREGERSDHWIVDNGLHHTSAQIKTASSALPMKNPSW